MERLLLANRKIKPHVHKKIQTDVNALKGHLISTLGNTWQQASAPRDQRNSLLVNPPYSPRPWVSVASSLNSGSFTAWVRHHLDTKVTWM